MAQEIKVKSQIQLKHHHIIGETIGDWYAAETPDGLIIWTRKQQLRFWKKQNDMVVFATPHYDQPNTIPVDVCASIKKMESPTLSTSFSVPGINMGQDKVIYMNKMKDILAMLK